jgi:hypothetical protein
MHRSICGNSRPEDASFDAKITPHHAISGSSSDGISSTQESTSTLYLQQQA